MKHSHHAIIISILGANLSTTLLRSRREVTQRRRTRTATTRSASTTGCPPGPRRCCGLRSQHMTLWMTTTMTILVGFNDSVSFRIKFVIQIPRSGMTSVKGMRTQRACTTWPPGISRSTCTRSGSNLARSSTSSSCRELT